MKGLFSILLLWASTVAALPTTQPASPGQVATKVSSELHDTVAIIGQDSHELLVQLESELFSLDASHSLAAIPGPVGAVVKAASNIDELFEQLSTPFQDSVAVVGQSGCILLVQLSPSAASLISGLGLEGITYPIGKVVTALGEQTKRQTTTQLVQELGSKVDSILVITGTNDQTILVELAPEAATLLSGSGLAGLGAPLGSVVAEAGSLTDLTAGLDPHEHNFLTAVTKEGQYLLVSLSSAVTSLLADLHLAGVGTPVGTVIREISGSF